VILVDTNLLLYAVDETSPVHERARSWLEGQLFDGPTGVGLPWQVLNGFARLVSNPRVCPNPMPVSRAWALAIQYGLVLCSTDDDFDRFPGLAWRNPLAS
jgi:hypothetical protein